MNRARRKEIDALLAQLEQIKERIEELASAEHDSFDNMPDSLQGGERGRGVEAAADKLDEAVESLGEALDNLGEAKE